MKKSFKWILGVSLVASTFMSGCGTSDSGEHEHTYASTYSYDANGHWIETTCEDHEVEKYNLALHIDSNNDGICDTCSYDEHSGAGHTYADVLSKDETNHWYAPTCGHDVAGKDVEAHVDANNDKVCDVAGCGYDYNHTHEYATTWSGDATNHWHAATCGCTIDGADKAAHVDEDKNGVCEVCQLATYEEGHDHTYATEWSSDEDNHWYAATCDHTGLKSSVTAHNDANKDGECDVCGWYDKDHTHTYANEWSKDENNHWHTANCGHTGLTADTSAHTMVNGECTVCGYDGNHEHAYSDVWTTDAEGHWHNATCGCALTVSYDEHDGMDDGVCDTCGYVADCAHTPGEAWITNETSHWHACADHPAVTYDKGSHTGMADGVCDTCGYKDYAEDHAHTYNTTWTSDYDGHWYASSCHSGVVQENSYAAHVDKDEDNKCDECDHELFAAVIERVTDKEGVDIIKKGMVSVKDYSSDEYYFEYGKEGYFHVLSLTGDYEYFYMAEGDGLFAVQVTAYGMSVPYGSTVNNLKGYAIEVGYNDGETGYGVANAIETFYALAVKNGGVTVKQNGDVYSFTGVNKAKTSFTVSFTFAEHTVYDDDWNASYITYVDWFQLVIDDDYGTTYEIEQTPGERTAKSPYTADEFLASEYNLDIYTSADVAVDYNTELSVVKGGGFKFYLMNVLPTTANLDFETLSYTIDGVANSKTLSISSYLDSDRPYFTISTNSSTTAGTYVVVVSTTKVSYTFTVTVTNPPVTQISAQVYDDSWSVVSEVSVYTGAVVQIRSQVNTNADASYTASITSDNAADVTLTTVEVPAQDMIWTVIPGYTRYDFTTTKAGTYVVTLVSAENSEITATLTITVSEPPKVEDVINGSYSYSDMYSGNTIYVTFTPATEGGLSGVAAIALVDSYDAVTTYSVNYVYAEATGFSLTNADGSAFTNVAFEYDNYAIVAIWSYEEWYGTAYVEGTLVESEPYTPPTAEEIVSGEYRYVVYAENGWSIASATDIVLNEDGTGTYTRWHYDTSSGSYVEVSDATATFKWTVVANADGSYTVTVTDVSDTTELAAGTWTVGTVSGTDSWGWPTTYTAITGVMVNGVATEFPIYE